MLESSGETNSYTFRAGLGLPANFYGRDFTLHYFDWNPQIAQRNLEIAHTCTCGTFALRPDPAV